MEKAIGLVLSSFLDWASLPPCFHVLKDFEVDKASYFTALLKIISAILDLYAILFWVA